MKSTCFCSKEVELVDGRLAAHDVPGGGLCKYSFTAPFSRTVPKSTEIITNDYNQHRVYKVVHDDGTDADFRPSGAFYA